MVRGVSDLPAIQAVASGGEWLNPRLLSLATGGAQISTEFWRENSAAIDSMLTFILISFTVIFFILDDLAK